MSSPTEANLNRPKLGEAKLRKRRGNFLEYHAIKQCEDSFVAALTLLPLLQHLPKPLHPLLHRQQFRPRLRGEFSFYADHVTGVIIPVTA
ncbi:MAG: hypothetical protein M2R45_01019 [Verrucomicrobia subdivision 3 bacterium]|nr:hypothetical protein [Limisphaerales bacterium]MCS1414131.1 hypothetical protein [Limisphaerales bacterium]